MSNIEETIKAAVAIADQLPEPYRVPAFTEVLRHKLAGGDNWDNASQRTIYTGIMPAAPRVTKAIASKIPEAHVVAESNNREHEVVWAVMTLCQKGQEADNEAIREEIRMGLGKQPQSRQNTNRTLLRLTPKYLKRQNKQEVKAFCYVPTAHAFEIFEALED